MEWEELKMVGWWSIKLKRMDGEVFKHSDFKFAGYSRQVSILDFRLSADFHLIGHDVDGINN